MTLLVRTVAQLRQALAARSAGTLGLVPTMGALHEGHATLLRQARAECRVVVLSVFVNPLQFGPHEDLAAYPRDLEGDVRVAEAEQVDIVFAPSVEEMYPAGFVTRVTVSGVSDAFDGAARPGHFTGVATVVLKLLNLVQPQRAYFGEKDWQQLSVIRRLAADLNLSAEVVGVPTVRAGAQQPEGGLALSSRNSYFTPAQRARAAVLARALRAVQGAYAGGERLPAHLRDAGLKVLAQESELSLDYLALVDGDMREIDPQDNKRVSHSASDLRLLIAARLFGVRLIDNMPLAALEQA